MNTETLNAVNESEVRTLSVDEIDEIDGGRCLTCAVTLYRAIATFF